MRIRHRIPAAVVAATLASGCSVVLVQGPPQPGEADYDPTGIYPAGVPCTPGRGWPLLDTAFALAALAGTVTADNRDDRIDGALTTAAAALSAWIGNRRVSACRAAMPG